MGTKGGKRTGEAKAAAEALVEALAPLGDVTSRGMFGGYGIFRGGVMFGLVDSNGVTHLRVDDETRSEFEEAGGSAHGRMPYFSVPDSIRADSDRLRTWASRAAAVAAAAKK